MGRRHRQPRGVPSHDIQRRHNEERIARAFERFEAHRFDAENLGDERRAFERAIRETYPELFV